MARYEGVSVKYLRPLLWSQLDADDDTRERLGDDVPEGEDALVLGDPDGSALFVVGTPDELREAVQALWLLVLDATAKREVG